MHEANQLKEENTKLRALVAILFSGSKLYGDDGELSDCSKMPFIDYKRDSVELIAFKIQQRRIQEYEASQARAG